jgi:hypothetical protein
MNCPGREAKAEFRTKNVVFKARRAEISVEKHPNEFSSSIQQRQILENRRMMRPRRKISAAA